MAPKPKEEDPKKKEVAKKAQKYTKKYLDNILGPNFQPAESSMQVHPPAPTMPAPREVVDVDEWDYDEFPLTQESERRLDLGERLDYEKSKYRKRMILIPETHDLLYFCSGIRAAKVQ